MRDGEILPEPSPATARQVLVEPPVRIALKAALYDTLRRTGISQRHLAKNLGAAESEVRHMPNPDRATRAGKIDNALRKLGKRVSVTVGEAA